MTYVGSSAFGEALDANAGRISPVKRRARVGPGARCGSRGSLLSPAAGNLHALALGSAEAGNPTTVSPTDQLLAGASRWDDDFKRSPTAGRAATRVGRGHSRRWPPTRSGIGA